MAVIDVFDAIANPVRRSLLDRLRGGGPQPVHELAEGFSMSRPAISQHLRILRDAELVGERRAGRERHYFLIAEPLARVDQWLEPYERFWRERLKALDDVLEAES